MKYYVLYIVNDNEKILDSWTSNYYTMSSYKENSIKKLYITEINAPNVRSLSMKLKELFDINLGNIPGLMLITKMSIDKKKYMIYKEKDDGYINPSSADLKHNLVQWYMSEILDNLLKASTLTSYMSKGPKLLSIFIMSRNRCKMGMDNVDMVYLWYYISLSYSGVNSIIADMVFINN